MTVDAPLLAVVLATLDRPSAVCAVLHQVLRQAPRRTEVVIVDQSDASARAQTAAAVRSAADPRVRHVVEPVRGLPNARNVGIAATTAPVVLFVDDDVVLHPGCLLAHLAPYRDPTVGGVQGRIVERVLQPNAWFTTNRVTWSGRIRTRLDGRDAVDVHTLKGANMSFRRVALQQAGGFDVGFGGSALLEDADASTRVARCGWRLRFAPDATVDHLHLAGGGVRDAPALWWRAHNTARFMRKHRGVWAGPGLALGTATLALMHAARTRSPGVVVELMRASARGWASG